MEINLRGLQSVMASPNCPPRHQGSNQRLQNPSGATIPLVECLILRFSGGTLYPRGTCVPTIMVDVKAIPHSVLKLHRHKWRKLRSGSAG
jgi:hypothetical protein